MGLIDRLLGGEMTSLNLEAKGFAYSQQGGMGGYGGGSSIPSNWFIDGPTAPTTREYARVRTELSSVLAVCICTVTNALPEAELCVEREVDGEAERQPKHPALMLVENPNPHHSAMDLGNCIARGLMTNGNGYAVKRRGRGGLPVELWPVEASQMRPVWPASGEEFISAYQLSVDGQFRYFDPSDVIHFRADLDMLPPSYGRMGLSPLPPIIQDLYTDTAAGDFTAAIMKNMGVPGAIVSPRVLVEGRAVSWPKPERDEFAADYQRRFTGQGRGRVMASGMPLDVQQLGFDPEKMSLREIRQVAEERVTAIYRIPAIVAGLGAGLEHATYANFETADRLFWRGCMIPLQRRIASALTWQLLRVDYPRTDDMYFEYNYDHIPALQESETDRRKRDREDWLAGGLTHHQYLGRLGIEPGGEDWRVLPVNVTVQPADAAPTPPAPVDAPTPILEPAKLAKKADGEPELGDPLDRSDDELADESEISDADIADAAVWVRERSPELADLLAAEQKRKASSDLNTKAAPYTWNPRTRRYYGAGGQMVPKAAVDAAVDGLVEAGRAEMAGYADALIAGEMDLAAYQIAMEGAIKRMHLATTATVRGGWSNLTPSERGRSARRIQEQYRYLNRSCLDFANGARDVDGRIRTSSQMYAASARTAYAEQDYEATREAVEAQPATHQERWVRHASDSCSGCISQSNRKWVPLGDLPEIGTQTCLTNCKCSKIVRRKPTKV